MDQDNREFYGRPSASRAFRAAGETALHAGRAAVVAYHRLRDFSQTRTAFEESRR